MYANTRDPRNDPANPVRRNAGRYERSDGLSGMDSYPSNLDKLGFVPPHTLGFVPPHTLGFAPLIATTAMPVIKSVASKIHISFGTPSATRARNVIGPVIQAANAGNLNAVAILDSRRSIGIDSERAVWSNGFAQVSPNVLAVYSPHRADLIAAIPESAQSGPEAAASWALQSPVSVPPSVLQQVADTVVPALLNTQAGQQIKAAAVSAAVKDQAAQAGDTLKKYAVPAVIIGAVLLLRGRR